MIATTLDAIAVLETANAHDVFIIAADEVEQIHQLLEHHRPSWYTLNHHLTLDTVIHMLRHNARIEEHEDLICGKQ